MTVAAAEEMAPGEHDPARARRRYAACGALLLIAGFVLARHSGTGDIGVITFGYGLGVAVAAALFALGWEPRRRKT